MITMQPGCVVASWSVRWSSVNVKLAGGLSCYYECKGHAMR